MNLADHFLTDRLREGRGDRVALRLDDGTRTYAEVEQRGLSHGRRARRGWTSAPRSGC